MEGYKICGDKIFKKKSTIFHFLKIIFLMIYAILITVSCKVSPMFFGVFIFRRRTSNRFPNIFFLVSHSPLESLAFPIVDRKPFWSGPISPESYRFPPPP